MAFSHVPSTSRVTGGWSIASLREVTTSTSASMTRTPAPLSSAPSVSPHPLLQHRFCQPSGSLASSARCLGLACLFVALLDCLIHCQPRVSLTYSVACGVCARGRAGVLFFIQTADAKPGGKHARRRRSLARQVASAAQLFACLSQSCPP